MVRILLLFFVVASSFDAIAQEFFTGTKNTTALISRMGGVKLGYALFRNASTGVQVLEHLNDVGDFYIRSVAYNVPNATGNILLNDLGGNVGIGTIRPTEKLTVNGTIRAKEIKVEAAPWPDYVFEEDYQLPSLQEAEQFIKANKHLPDVPSANDVADNGIALGEMNAILLKKVEELTLHLIEKDKAISILQEQVKEFGSIKLQLQELTNRVNSSKKF